MNFIKRKVVSLQKLFVKLPSVHRKLIVALLAICCLVLIMPESQQRAQYILTLPTLSDPEYVAEPLAVIMHKKIPDYEWVVSIGDTLGEAFSLFNMSYTMTKILEADKDVLSLDIINKGDKYRFWFSGNEDNFDDQGVVLQKMEQVLGVAHQVAFIRNGDGFEYKETIIDGIWDNVRIAGEIKSGSSFNQAALAKGLSPNNAQAIKGLLKTQTNISKANVGDRFQIILSSQFVRGIPTGNTKIAGVRYIKRKQSYCVFSFNVSYFDTQGEGLERAFSKYPLKSGFRISSNFNPRRRHPITKLIRPHNGTDFAVRTGTAVYSPGDGVVKRVVRHKYAGLYIEIQHSYKYRTRFLHLSKALVRKGQRVTRGKKIALSGNTGASTGPHLHYEFHVNQKPVNAMGKKVPIAIGVSKKSMTKYNRRVSSLVKMMEDESLTSVATNKSNKS